MSLGNSIDRIVVRGTNWIGDAVMSVPAMRELSRLFPNAEIVLHTKDNIEGLFEDADFIDRILPFQKRSSRLRQAVAQADLLGDNEFDLAILFPNSFESALTTSLARIPRRIGYNKDLRGLLLTQPVPVPEWKDKRHEVYYYLNLVAEVERRFLGSSTVGTYEPDIALSVSDERQETARRRLEGSGIDLSKPIVAVGAGSTNSMAKRWGTQNFADLAGRLTREFAAQVLLVGTASEVDVADEIRKGSSFSILDLTGKTDVAEAAAILSVTDLLVANDMGLAHVAPAVGTPTAVIFGPTDPVTTRPFSDQAIVVRNAVECSPCMLRKCPIDHRCMTGVSVDRVFDFCRELLQGPPSPE